jgi:hypothetical protein
MSQLPTPRARADDTSLVALGLAHGRIDAWLSDPMRSGAAQRRVGQECLRKATMFRVETVLGSDQPGAANRRWLCETVRAWAPLEVLFPSNASSGTSGVTGELPRHLPLIVQREYRHVGAGRRSTSRVSDALYGDVQRLALELEIGTALRELLEEKAADDWLRPHMDMSLAMAEYLHRQVIGLSQVLSDSLVMTYATGISRTHRTLRPACLRPVETVAL